MECYILSEHSMFFRWQTGLKESIILSQQHQKEFHHWLQRVTTIDKKCVVLCLANHCHIKSFTSLMIPLHQNLSKILDTVFFTPKRPDVESMWQVRRILTCSSRVRMYLSSNTCDVELNDNPVSYHTYLS